jgi:uncharacterized protein (DUF58 family)
MRKIIIDKIIRRTGWGLGFVFLSYVITLLGLKELMLNIRFGYAPVDFMYVLLVAFIPDIIAGIGYGILFSVAFLLLRYMLLPVHRVERHYMGIKGGGLRKYLFIITIIVLLLFIVPYFIRDNSPFGYFLSGIDRSSLQLSSVVYGIGGYAGAVLGPLASAVALLLNLMFIKPLFLFYSVRSDALVASLFLSALFYHTMMVSFSKKHIRIERRASKHLCQEGEEIVMRTSLHSPFPAPNVSLPRCSVASGRIKERKNKSRINLFSTRLENNETISLKEGYYNFDIVPIKIFTFPFFHTRIYRVCDLNSDVSVVPRLHFKTRVMIQKPSVVRESGSLIKKQLGSSLDFAGMREYYHDDPFSRIWWKGLAKYGKLLVKEFHSFGEDRWMLVLDFTNPNLDEEGVKGMLRFARLFIELCTRKDIAVGLSAFSPTFHYVDYNINKRDLLSSLTRVTSPLYEISPRGMELIMQDALGSDFERLKIKCRKKSMTLSMVYSYSGLGKQKTFFSWRGENTFRESMKRFFINMRKSGKIVLVTDGNPRNLGMFNKFKAICVNRHYNYLFVLTQSRGDMLEQMKMAKIKVIFAPYDQLTKPGFIMKLASLV